MKYLKSYKLFESRGVPQSSLVYFDSIYRMVLSHLDEYLKSDKKSIVNRIELDFDNVSSEFPISKIHLITKFDPTLRNYGWEFSSTGDCRPFIDGGSQILDDGTILLKFEIGVLLDNKKITKSKLQKIKTDIESSIHHELNHGFEHYNRKLKNYPPVQDALAFAVDVNVNNIPNKIWDFWQRHISYNLYYTEKFEINAITQESIPYVKKYPIEKLKRNWRGWGIITGLVNFDDIKFKKQIFNLIKREYPKRDPNKVLNSLKRGLSKSLNTLMVKYKEENPSILPSSIESMTIDDLLKYCKNRFNKGGEELRRRVIRNYSNIK